MIAACSSLLPAAEECRMKPSVGEGAGGLCGLAASYWLRWPSEKLTNRPGIQLLKVLGGQVSRERELLAHIKSESFTIPGKFGDTLYLIIQV